MKGKKKDLNFINDFINDCIKLQKLTPEEIVAESVLRINEIDLKIKEVEKLRIIRSKLLDVAEVFTEKDVTSKVNDIQIINFLNIKNIDLCNKICLLVENNPIDFTKISLNYKEEDIFFCIKQLVKHHIIEKDKNLIQCGCNFANYKNFLKEISR